MSIVHTAFRLAYRHFLFAGVREEWSERTGVGKTYDAKLSVQEMIDVASCDQLTQMHSIVDIDSTTTGGLRFEVGDKVEANLGKEGYLEGTIKAVNVDGAAYKVQLNDGSAVLAKKDTDKWIRAAKGLKRSNYRFNVGDRVEANMGKEGYLAGTIKEVNSQGAAYKIRLADGSAVLAKKDTDDFVRRA